MKNPFIFGTPVTPRDFYGRKSTVHFMMDRLYGRSRSSVALWGDRRVGKTSLLYFLMQEDLRLDYVEELDKHHVIFIDCQIFTTNFNRHLFWLEVLEQLSETVVSNRVIDEIERLLGVNPIKDRDIRRLLRRMHQDGETLTLLLDEFSHIIWSGQLNDPQEVQAFLAFMRTALTAVMPSSRSTYPRPIALVTATRRPLNEVVQPVYGTSDIGSPFHNPFVFDRLQPFTEETVLTLLDSKLADSPIQFTEAERQHLLTQTGRHPILVQSYGSELFIAKKTIAGDVVDFEPIDNEFYDRSQHHFQAFWQYSSQQEQDLLVQILKNDFDIFETGEQNALRQLVERGLLFPPNQFFSPLFKEWLRLNLDRLVHEREQNEPLPDGVMLLQVLDSYFSESDLNEILFEMGIDDENLPGETKRDKMRELIRWAQLRAYIPKLVGIMKQKRPFLKL
ncbi:MAG: hypothetical protein AAF490_02100 [Chloroflexota bacterium]